MKRVIIFRNFNKKKCIVEYPIVELIFKEKLKDIKFYKIHYYTFT